MPQFKGGQEVKCVRHDGARPHLREGRTYIVAHHFRADELADKNGSTSGGVMLQNHKNGRSGEVIRPPNFYAANRFEAVNREAVDVDNDDAGEDDDED